MLSLFPRDVLDEIWDLIESVSEGFTLVLILISMFLGKYIFANRTTKCLWNHGRTKGEG